MAINRIHEYVNMEFPSLGNHCSVRACNQLGNFSNCHTFIISCASKRVCSSHVTNEFSPLSQTSCRSSVMLATEYFGPLCSVFPIRDSNTFIANSKDHRSLSAHQCEESHTKVHAWRREKG